MSRLPLRSLNDRNDTHVRYTTSLIQRQEQASAYYRTQSRDRSRPSSSSGSAVSGASSLRRTTKFESRPSRLRSSSVDSAPSQVDSKLDSRQQRHLSPQRTSHRRAASAHYNSTSYTPHSALRLSRRTKAAITYALEVAVREPQGFTPDLAEENAQMSDLGGGRAANGGARTSGPVPVPSTGTPTGMRTPRDIMRDRNAREARRQEEQKAEEQRRVAEERRRSAERRGAAPRTSQASSQYTPDLSAPPAAASDVRRSGSGRVAGSDVLGDPTGRTSAQEYPSSRARGPSVSQPDQPRPATSRRTQASQSAPRQPSSGAAPSQQPQTEGGAQRNTTSSFPHAFERWETLSSHWEGLTSYWLHKLEQNTEEIRDTVPNAVTLNRQITDLSAAGANLFHAVVELQRLRASSERKFQRWFFETRGESERAREIQAQCEYQLGIERKARDEEARKKAELLIIADNAKREVAEMRRELNISKEEARRAWEELGRRNQESVETANSLKEGRVTVVGGVQVVPYMGGPSRTGSASLRPTTRDGQPQYGNVGTSPATGAAGMQSPEDERDYYQYQQEASPTNTDPFMDTGAQGQSSPGVQSLAAGTYQPYQVGGTPTTSSTAQTVIPMPLMGQRPAPASAGSLGPSRTPTAAAVPVTTQDAQRFYQHGPQETFLHSPQSSSQAIAGPATASTSQAPPTSRQEVQSEGSYVDTMSEGDTEYAIDAGGNIRHDEQGQPIVFRRRTQSNNTDDSYDTEADIRREQELRSRYGSGMLPEAPVAPGTSAQAMANYTPTTGEGPDYEGSGYSGWETMQTRHHHPTRLSDVPEEEEERSSRRTAG